MNRRALTTGIWLIASFCAHAQAPDPATRELIEKLLARIDGLEKRISQLETENGPRAAATATAAVKPPAQDLTAAHSHDQAPPPQLPVTEPPQPVYPSLKFAGFA